MAGLKVFLLASLCVAAVATNTNDQSALVETLADNEAQAPAEGNDVARCWRIKSLVRGNGPREGFEWQVVAAKFFTSEDGSGTPLTGEAMSSGDQVATDPAGKDGKAANAFDGKDDTAWVAKRMDAGEYVGLKLTEAKEVKSVRIKQLDEAHGVRAAVLEKSQDCQYFARVAEFPEFPKSYGKEQFFSFAGLYETPPGVFQIRSRHNVNLCFGVEIPKSQIEDVEGGVPQKSFDEGAKVELQNCNIDVVPQYFSFNKNGDVVSAQNNKMVLTLPDAASAPGQPAQSPKEGGTVVMKECKDGCPNINSAFRLDRIEGLLVHTKTIGMLLQPTGGALKKKTPIITSECAKDGKQAALHECKDKTYAQWDLIPLFTIEKNKKANNCAPYSHTKALQPLVAATQKAAQRACAKDPDCTVYMYTDSTAEPANDRHKVWLCTRLNEVNTGTDAAGSPKFSGYQLGFRAQNDNRRLSDSFKNEHGYEL
jgi:hypothetical protein